jgi:ABC-type Fe3+/spermidine/putrescine transport system ATPase subunit
VGSLTANERQRACRLHHGHVGEGMPEAAHPEIFAGRGADRTERQIRRSVAVGFRVDAKDGEDAVMRIDDAERIVVAATGTAAGAGATLLVAVRPERIQLEPGETDGEAGSRVTGKVAQVVYLGTLTQFHVDTRIGKRLVVHRLSDEGTAGVAEGDTVTLTWTREDASILRESV